jgi:hypothetical protein
MCARRLSRTGRQSEESARKVRAKSSGKVPAKSRLPAAARDLRGLLRSFSQTVTDGAAVRGKRARACACHDEHGISRWESLAQHRHASLVVNLNRISSKILATPLSL